MVGTSVRVSRYESSMANTTAIASGVNRYFAVPVSSSTGTKTMQMESVETKAGTAICCAPSRIARVMGFCIPILRWMFSISTVASSTRMPTASASPPNVITLTVSPNRPSTISEVRIDNGIEMQTIRVLRQLPRKSRIIMPVSAGGDSAFAQNALNRGAHEQRLIEQLLNFERFRQPAVTRGRAALTELMMSSVEALPFFSTTRRAARLPLEAHDIRLHGKPSRTCATSLMNTVAPLVVWMGR